MPVMIGALMALGAAGFGAASGFDRSRAFYPLTLVVIASYYVLFAIMADARGALAADVLVFCAFCAAGVLGFRGNLWVAVAGLASHALLDLVHGAIIPNPGVPPWWPAFCLAYDMTAAGCLATVILRGPRAVDGVSRLTRPPDPL